MKTGSIAENNRLFAEFMGYKNMGRGYFKIPEHAYEEYNSEDRSVEIVEDFSVLWDEMKFHSSYDWLMPVVHKLQEVTEEPEELDELKYNLWFNTIEGVYSAVVDLIKQYNQNNS